MDEPSKYLIHADVTADGIVERSDVVGAIFGQTEGLLGDGLDLRELRHAQKVGRIDVEIETAAGRSAGTLTLATSLDRVETATLAAALETIDRVGPCRAELTVTTIEDVRAAKRTAVIERATELLRTGFDDTVLSSEEILAAVREHVRVEDITEYEGLPAGPRVAGGDAIIVVEGRADVKTLLRYGVKNAVAVEGTDVPDAIADLTRERTVTAFFDGDRGGELILEELTQVGEVDYVAFAPTGSAVEDLDHHQLFTALREKIPIEQVGPDDRPSPAQAATDGSAHPLPQTSDGSEGQQVRPTEPVTNPGQSGSLETPAAGEAGEKSGDSTTAQATVGKATAEPVRGDADGPLEPTPSDPPSLGDHVATVMDDGTDGVRLLDDTGRIVAETEASGVEHALEDHDAVATVVLDGVLEQRVLDVAADRGIARIVARSLGQFTKRPTGVRIHTPDDVADPPSPS